MEIYISSDRYQKEFIDPVLEEITSRHEAAKGSNIDIIPIYPPRNLGRNPVNILERVNQIKTASIVIMNATPIGSIKRVVDNQEKTIYVINSGVSAEFGILMGINRTEKCHLFCSSEFDVGPLSPIFHAQNIDHFNPKDPTPLKTSVGNYIGEYLRKSTDLFEKYASGFTASSV